MLCKGTVQADGVRRGANRCLGGRRAGLPRGLAVLAGGAITTGAGRGTSPARPGDGRRLPLHLLVEDVLGLRLGQGVPVGYGLDGRVVPTREYMALTHYPALSRDEGDDAHSVR